MTAMRLKMYPSPSGGFALGKMGVGATLLKQGKTAKDYVQSGLVAMWDGIENAGWGVHDPNATTWVDLSGNGYNFSIPNSGASFSDKSINLSGISISANLPEVSRQEATIECVAESTGAYGAWVWMKNPTWIGGALLNWGSQFICYTPWSETGRLSGQSLRHAAMTWNSNRQVLYENGVGINTTQNAIDPRNILAQIYLGEYNNSLRGSMSGYSIRFYSRALTADEIAANYAIDKERFNLP